VSQADIDLVVDQFEAVNERDFERAMDHYAEDVVLIVPPAEQAPEPGTFEGKEAVGEWFGNWFRAFRRGYHFEIEEARKLDDLIFIVAKHGGKGRVSGIEVGGRLYYLYRIKDGKVAHVRIFPTRDAALEAAGSPE
jgi:ketosteroid isomerase-like protein